jgi:restriction system protein
MTKKQDSLVEEIVKSFYEAPLWAAPLGIGLLFLFGAVFVPGRLASTTWGSKLGPLAATLTFWLCVVCAAAALLGAGKRSLERIGDSATFNRQSGIESIRSLRWQDFERMVGEAYRREGYAVEISPAGADGGKDVILTSAAGTIYVQCKRWRDKVVGVNLVRELKGSMAAARVEFGIFVSSGRFTADAERFAHATGIELVDGKALERLVRGLQPAPRGALLSPVDAPSGAELRDCPKCGSRMVRKRAHRGRYAGKDFLGCSRYPDCNGIRNLS